VVHDHPLARSAQHKADRSTDPYPQDAGECSEVPTAGDRDLAPRAPDKRRSEYKRGQPRCGTCFLALCGNCTHGHASWLLTRLSAASTVIVFYSPCAF
jgi:hypothetical protein